MALVQQLPAPANAQLARFQGEARPVTLTVAINGVPKDLSGYQFTVTVSKSPNAVPVYKGVSTVGDGTSGTIALNLPSSATAVAPGNYAMEIRYLTPGGIDQVVALFSLLIQPSLSLS